MNINRILPFLIIGLLGAACQDDNDKAKLVIRLTDSPGDYQKVNIDIQGIEVNGEGGWTSLPNVNDGIYNLLDFTDGRETVLTSTEYPTGKINQIRLMLGPDNSVEIDGETIHLETPSAQQSGLKLLLNAELTAGITYAILLDFEAAKSVVKTGSDKYILKPVIKVVSEAQDGAIEGKVTPAELNVAVFAIMGQDTVGTSYVQPGVTDFFVGGLTPGAYTVSFDPGELSGYDAVTQENINVTLGAITSMGTTELELK